MVALQAQQWCFCSNEPPPSLHRAVPPCQQLKLLNNTDGLLITFSALLFSIFITVKQANAAFAEVLAGSL